jgi:hypothetical protein
MFIPPMIASIWSETDLGSYVGSTFADFTSWQYNLLFGGLSTYPSTLGLEGARRRAAETQERAVAALHTLGAESRGLLWLSDFILARSS